MERHSLTLPAHPTILLIDADEARGQRVATTLTLADFAVYVTATPYQALERELRDSITPVVVVLGQGDWQSRATDMVMRRLYGRFYERAAQPIPTLYLPASSNPTYPSLGDGRPSYPPTTSAPSLAPRSSAPSRPVGRPGDFPSNPSHPAYPAYPAYPAHPAYPAYPSNPSYPSQPSRPTLPDDLSQIEGFGRLPSLQSEGAWVLEQIWRLAPDTYRDMRPSADTLVNTDLPAYGLKPRIAQKLLSSNDHARQVIEAAYAVIGADRWADAMTNVGLAWLSQPDRWPPENDERVIPAILFSQLNVAVERSWPAAPAEQLRRWSDAGTEASLARHSPSWVAQQVIKHLPHERALALALNGFTAEMNKTRGEELHFWKPRGDGSYWLVHYSNLYAYGRARRAEPSCFVWLASIEATLQLVQVDSVYDVSEVECSCQTLTGHCVFLIEPRLVHPK